MSAEIGVGDTYIVQRPLQRFVVEMRRVTAVGSGADVDNFVYAVSDQQVNERLWRVIGVTDGEDGVLGRIHWAGLPHGLMIVAISL